MPNFEFHEKDEDRPDEMFALLAALPHVAPNVESLAIWAPFNADEFGPHVIDAIRNLANFQDLKQLTIGNVCGLSRQLSDLCETVARMRSLRRLKLTDWTCPEAYPSTIPDFLSKLPPYSKLTEIDFAWKADESSEQYLRWLFQPCEDYALKKLTLCGHDIGNEEHGTQDYPLPVVVRPALSQLETLTLDVDHFFIETKEMYDIFPFCATLRSLRLRFIHRDNLAAFLKSEYSLLLPNSLAELRITVGIKGSTGGRDILDGWDTRFVEILSTLPSLRAFTMPQIQDLAHWDGPDGRAYVDNFPLNLPKTEYHCAEHGFNLVFCPRQNPN